jgi:hypothetical protein
MKKGDDYMNATIMKAAKVAVKVLGVAVPIAANYFADKDLNEKIAKEVAKQMKRGS